MHMESEYYDAFLKSNLVVGLCIALLWAWYSLTLSWIFFTEQDFCLDNAIINLESQEEIRIYFAVVQLNVQL